MRQVLVEERERSGLGRERVRRERGHAVRTHIELVLAERHGFVVGAAFGAVILIPESDALLVWGDKPLV